MYDLVPTKEFAMESINCPLTPKSHNLISPRELTKMFDGFTSVEKEMFTEVISYLFRRFCQIQ